VNRTAVQIFEGITLSALATAIPAGTTWTADPVHSTVGFSVKHMVVSTFRGRFEDFDATLTAAGDGTLRLDGRVRAESIVVKDENLAAHLRSADFFDTARFPEITFASTLVRAEDGELVVEGELTVKGRTRPLRARGTLTEPLETLGGTVKAGLELEATVDRREYGLDWNAPLPKGGFALDNDVRLQVNLELLEA
jgi:polyisoprenoid-binding protein YceI